MVRHRRYVRSSAVGTLTYMSPTKFAEFMAKAQEAEDQAQNTTESKCAERWRELAGNYGDLATIERFREWKKDKDLDNGRV
jgi:glucose-6-phosphate isomerase